MTTVGECFSSIFNLSLNKIILFSLTLLVIFISYIFYQFNMPKENDPEIYGIFENKEENMKKFMEKNISAFVLGYTGETGKELVKQLVESKAFKRILLLGRRKVEFDENMAGHVEQHVIDFDNLGEHADAFKDIEVGYCCLGTTRGKAGKEGFIKVDYTYVLNSAEIAKANGCKQFHLVSSQGASKTSSFLYPQIKGKIEEAVTNLGFERLGIYRPAVIMVDRQESRPMETAFRFLMKPVAKFAPAAMTTPISTIAAAMMYYTFSEPLEKVKMFDNQEIHKMGGAIKR